MSLHGVKKPLHLAKSVKELNQLANTPTGNHNLRLLAKSTQMLLKNASEHYLEGDQERAYVLFMRFFNVVTCVKKSKEYSKDKAYYDALIGDSNCRMAIERAEELSNDLKRRYEVLVAQEASNNLEEEEQNKIKLDAVKSNEEKHIICDVSAPQGWVCVSKLYEWFKDENIKVLLVDIRSEEEFVSSHINKLSDVINTPDVLPGSTAKNIEYKLSGTDLLCWNHRADYDIVVICDLCTTHQTFDEETSPLAYFKAAIVKWDLETKLKNEPLFLMGGYKDWAEKFPTFINKPLPKEESIYSKNNKSYKNDIKALLDSIDYDIDLSYLNAPDSTLANDKNSVDFTKSASSVPIVDRSKKPKGESSMEIHRNDPHKEVLTNGVLVPNTSSNAPAVMANRTLKPNVGAKQEINKPSSSPKNNKNRPLQQEEQVIKNVSELPPSISKLENRDVELLKIEILNLEEKKKRLEMEVAAMDKQKATESEKTKLEIGRENILSQEKAKQAREVAVLLREKRKLAQELNEMAKQKNYILNENTSKGNANTSTSQITNGISNSSYNSHNGHSSPTFPQKIITKRDRSSSPSQAVNYIKTSSHVPVNQTVMGTNENLIEKSSSKPEEAVNKSLNKASLQIGKSDRASPKRVTVRLDVETSPSNDAPKSNLKRFHSFPNIAKLIEEGEEMETTGPSTTQGTSKPDRKLFQAKNNESSVPSKIQVQPPRVDRSIKPTNSYKSLLEAKVRNFQPLWGSLGLGLTGLRNLGNTCYMNSIVQCLSNCVVFFKYFNDSHYQKDINWSNQDGYCGEVAIEFAAVIKNLWTGQYKAISPIDFRAAVSKFGATFASTQHQDAQELLEFLMNGLNEDLNRVKMKPQLKTQQTSKLEDEVAAEKAWQEFLMVENSVIVDLFRGQYKSRVMCSFCETKSTVFEPFMSLNLQIPENQSKCSLSDCLLHFSNEEKMTGDSRWLCPHCKQKRESTKRIVVWRLPQILIIHLKRFHYQGIWRNKISTNVSFPITNLDMSRYISGPRSCDSNRNTTYNLFAVCNHYGTLDGGHYTAFCKNASSRNWYKFDDSDVSEISPSSIQSSAAYLLFYAKSGLWPQ